MHVLNQKDQSSCVSPIMLINSQSIASLDQHYITLLADIKEKPSKETLGIDQKELFLENIVAIYVNDTDIN